MKIPNKEKIQQTPFNHLIDISFKDFINLYNPKLFLVIDAILAWDNLVHFYFF